MQRARIVLSKKALAQNVDFFKQKNKHLIGVVKDNAYGHGSVLVSHQLEQLGVSLFAVTTFEEALELRNSGIKSEILILGPIEPHELILCSKNQFAIAIVSLNHLKKLVGVSFNGMVKCHLKIDTGFHRWGIQPKELQECVTLFKRNPHFLWDGLFTHYIGGQKEKNILTQQWNVFKNTLHSLPFRPQWIHAASTHSCFQLEENETNAIRIGLGLYGLHYQGSPILSLESPIGRVQWIEKGDRVSYFYQQEAETSGYLYTLPLGYGDGWSPNFRTVITPSKKRAPVLGAITMDAMMVFSSELFPLDSWFELIGKNQTIDDLSIISDESIYLISTRLSSRLDRQFL